MSAARRYLAPRPTLVSGMSNLRQIRRMVTGLAAVTFALLVILGSHHSAQAAPTATVHRPSAMSQMTWTPTLAARFDGCAAKVHGVPSAFVVERLDGSLQRMTFDHAWRRTHDREHADDIWVRGMCR